MRTLFLTSVFTPLALLSALAESPLKLELLTPKEPITLKKEDVDKPGVGTAHPSIVNITLRYRITNTGKKEIVIKQGGDESTNSLTIRGPGATNVPYRGMMTEEFRAGKPITIGGDETKEFEIKGLRYGNRDMSYWSIIKSGNYEVTLTHHTRAGQGTVSLTSEPAKLSVVVK